jgi:hypothetical protein
MLYPLSYGGRPSDSIGLARWRDGAYRTWLALTERQRRAYAVG